MADTKKIIHSAILSVITITSIASTTLTFAADKPDQEKCYGIVKAGMNDCETKTASCSGSSVKDNQPDAFVLVPKGLCNKIVGGSLKSKG